MTEVNKRKLSGITLTPTLSVPDDTTVTYGQQFYLDVTLSTEASFPSGIPLNVTVKENSGIKIQLIGNIPVTSNMENSITGHYLVAIEDTNTNIKNGQVSFNIELALPIHPYNKDFKYNVKKIIPYSLQLQSDKLVCVIPEEYSKPDNNDPQDTYILYKTTLLEDTGSSLSKTPSNTPLKNTLVYLVSSPILDITRDVIVTSDSNTEPLITYTPSSYGDGDGGLTFINLISDNNTGEIRFRVYSNNKPIISGGAPDYKPTVLSLGCEVITEDYQVGEGYMARKVCFITPRPFWALGELAQLYIPDANNGNIIGDPDSPSFNAEIQTDANYKANDQLLFFTKEKGSEPDISSLIQPINFMHGDDNDIYSYPIPYNSFTVNKESEIFYVIARVGETLYSRIKEIKYMGGGSEDIPPGTVSRIYNKVEVFSSYADYNNDNKLSNPGELGAKIFEDDLTTRAQLANYIFNGGNDAYLRIVATNDPADTKRPKAGSDIYVNMYIKSANKNLFQPINKNQKINLSSTLDKYPVGNIYLCSTVVPIPHPFYTDIDAYENESAMVYFEYYTKDKNNMRTYSEYWHGLTDTSASI
ncbi:hypothetical protein Xsto_02886 [Xenorhabdus stockiae]|uniref:Uncharacterized protein n=1 Tax=Xenorhabdus stockiae TaxID=351614 RepID=A0A2D0KMF3_9GAMM|nr:hypothetical protein [Xenorhabdus stockiae]PHM64611.1 hypothetical protein Xsto_02886 [Xenorhabdus stockiae]